MYSLHRIIVSLFFVFHLLNASGGNPYRFPAGAAEAGMGSLSIVKTGFWPLFRNPALLPFNKSFSAGIDYQNRFCIPELGSRTAGMTIPAGRTTLGIVYSHFGYTDFRRQSAGLGCGLTLSKKITAGVQVDYLAEKTSGEYDGYRTVTCDVGLTIRASDNAMIGIHLFNPVPNSLRKSKLPAMLTAGVGIELSKMLFAGAEAEMSTGEKLILRTGFEYEMVKKLWLRGGFCTENTSFSFGLGYLLKSIRIDLGFATHEKLGVTSSASIVFKIH